MIGTSLPLKAARSGGPVVDDDERFADRAVAGRLLAEQLGAYRGDRALVLALPPGGVALAGELAHALRLPLDVLVARAFSAPANPTLVLGAFSEGGGLCFNRTALRLPQLTLSGAWRVARRARLDAIVLVAAYRGAPRLPLLNRRSTSWSTTGWGAAWRNSPRCRRCAERMDIA